MKIYITGTTASGKSTISKIISEKYRLPVIELDRIYYLRPDKPDKRSAEEINNIINELISRPNWIFEDVGRTEFNSGIKAADFVVLLNPSIEELKQRIEKRYQDYQNGINMTTYVLDKDMLARQHKRLSQFDPEELLKQLIELNENIVIISEPNQDQVLEVIEKEIAKRWDNVQNWEPRN